MKKWIIIILGYVVLIALLLISFKGRSSYEDKWKTATANVKAYDELLSSSKEKNTAYQLTIDQLNYANDSILQELNEARKELKVKDKDVKSVQYVASTFTKTDSIVLRDTIFKENIIDVDTLIGDVWYTARLILQYPSTIVTSPQFRSVKNIVVSTKKETVNPPKKCWLLRLLQKKHTVLNVDIIEKNPYVTEQQSRYVEILK